MKKKKMLTLITALTLGMTSFATIPITTMAYEPIESYLLYEHEGEGNIEIANVGAEVGFMIKGLKDGESIEYSLSDSDIAKIIYEDNTQVTVSCLKAGTTTLTAKSSDGQSFDIVFEISDVDDEPVPVENSKDEKLTYEHEGEGNVEIANVGAEVGFMIKGLKDGESIEYSLSDSDIAKIIYEDNTQVTVSCLKAGTTTLTAKSSDGQSFDIVFEISDIDDEPVPVENSKDEKLTYEHEGEGNVEIANVGAEVGFMIKGLKDGESIEYSLSDSDIAKIIYEDNTQVTVSCLKAGTTTLTAKSSDGQSFDIVFEISDVDDEPVPVENSKDEKLTYEHEGEGNVEIANVGAEVGFMIKGLKDGESIEYSLSDSDIAKIIYEDNTQVTVSCLKAGTTTLTAKSSDGQSFDIVFEISDVDDEPVPVDDTTKDENKLSYQHEGDGNVEIANVGAKVGFMITGLKEGETIEYSLSNSDIAKIIYEDNTQVTVSCLKAGTTTLTAKSSDGQSFEIVFDISDVDDDPVPSDDTQLPQTGYSNIYKVIAGLAAFMTVSGTAIVARSKKKDE